MSRKDWIIKSVSIEPKDAVIIRAQGEGFNLSAFVRECLRRLENHQQTASHIHRQPGIQERNGFCMPQSACPKCWPDGVPTMGNWHLFRGKNPAAPTQPYTGPEVGNIPWLQATIETPFDITSIEAKGNAKPTKRDRDASRARKMWGGRLKFWKRKVKI